MPEIVSAIPFGSRDFTIVHLITKLENSDEVASEVVTLRPGVISFDRVEDGLNTTISRHFLRCLEQYYWKKRYEVDPGSRHHYAPFGLEFDWLD
jgi:hypothetical protein